MTTLGIEANIIAHLSNRLAKSPPCEDFRFFCLFNPLPSKIRMWGGSVRMKEESEMCKRRTCIHSPRERDCQEHLIRE